MTKYNTLFPTKYLQDRLHLSALNIEDMKEKQSVVERWKYEIDTKSIYTKKEEQLQSDFLNDIFGKVLGYAYERGLDELNLEKEQKSKTDGTKPDGVLGYLTADNKDIRVVIELKDAYTNLDHKQNRKNDSRTPVEQAFSYVSKCGGKCKWVIVSNFVEIRLYPANDSSVYQSFNIVDLIKSEKFKEFYALLAKDNLFIQRGNSKIDDLLKVKIEADENITNEFYGVYKNLRSQLFKHIKENNPSIDENTILTKSQKILDRIIFICFCEDLGLLPYKVFKEILHQTQTARFIMTDTRLWEEIKGLFTAIDKGYPQENINRFNGGLFKADDVIDNLIIRDSILKEILSIERYSFDSDLNVNILGHIFEQSITDLEELKSVINGENFDKKKGKRKKDGVFYTPEYITKYIVNEAVGSWLEDKKKELGYYGLPKIDDEQWRRIKTGKVQKNNKTIKAHLNFWLEYRKALDNIKVLDPACGSGSFLVQVFDYLKEQRNQVNEEIATFEGTQSELFNQDTHILSNNIYGVDLNAESVEITKLALWLKTANKKDPLTALDNNIKCGNSLIDDVTVAGDKAFNWNKEFPEIMENGGFDVVVGNPPYIFARNKSFSEREKNYYYKKYKQALYQINTYVLFIEQAYNLIKRHSYLGYIVPNTFLTINSFKELRAFILKETNDIQIINIFDKVFNDAAVDTCIMILKKELGSKLSLGEMRERILTLNQNVDKKDVMIDEYIINISTHQNPIISKILNKINSKSQKIQDFSNVVAGLQAYETGKGTPKQTEDMKKNRVYHSNNPINTTYKKYLEGSDVCRYFLGWSGEYLSYGNWLAAPRKPEYYEKERILVRQIPSKLPYCINAVYTNERLLNDRNSMIILDFKENPKLLLALLNSKLMSFWFIYTFDKLQRGTFPQFKVNELKQFPIVQIKQEFKINLINFADIILLQNKELHEKSSHFINLLKAEYETIEISGKLNNWYELDWKQFTNELKKQKIVFSGSQKDDWFERFNRVSTEIKELQKTIDETDKQIDSLIYKLYNLTDEEIKIIEEKY